MLRAGIVGLPNAGKSTLFNALTRGHQAPVASYPFCTIEPNIGVIEVPDDRLDRLVPVYGSAKKIAATIEFFDIAGLVRGASKGEGLGNRFLANIREVDAIVEVVRCFEQPDVAHVEGEIDPVRDVETIRTELALSDLETIGRRKEKFDKLARAGEKEARVTMAAMNRIEEALDAAGGLRGLDLSPDEASIMKELCLLTSKPIIYAANLSESDLSGGSPHVEALAKLASSEGSELVVLAAELEAQLADLSPREAQDYLAELGVETAGVDRLIAGAYRALGLITFFTGNEKEVRARAIPTGTTAHDAAGLIHTDIARGFIGAEVIPFELLMKETSLHQAREDGKLRLEGKDYQVADGDVIFFRFNV